MRDRLPENSVLRGLIVVVATVAATLVITQFVMPGSPGVGARGTPFARLYEGIVQGLVISLTAAGIVLI